MPQRELTPEVSRVADGLGWRIRLRPKGWGRFVAAAFLTVWLCGWAVGEAAFLGGLGYVALHAYESPAAWLEPLRTRPELWLVVLLVALFALFWGTFWTYGGLSAMGEVLRLLAGEDLIRYGPSGIELQQRFGPFRRTRRWRAAQVLRIYLRRRDKALALDAPKPEALTSLGTPEEREQLRDTLLAALGRSGQEQPAPADQSAALPMGWSSSQQAPWTLLHEPQHRGSALGCLLPFVLLFSGSLVAVWSAKAGPLLLLLLLGLLLGTLWLLYRALFTSETWALAPGVIEHRRRSGGREVVTRFEQPAMVLKLWEDSDGDEHFELQVKTATQSRKVASEMHEARSMLRLGHLFAQGARVHFDIPMQLRKDR